MGVVAWIVLGLLAGVVARLVTGSRVPHRPHRPLITAVIVKTPPASATFDDPR